MLSLKDLKRLAKERGLRRYHNLNIIENTNSYPEKRFF